MLRELVAKRLAQRLQDPCEAAVPMWDGEGFEEVLKRGREGERPCLRAARGGA